MSKFSNELRIEAINYVKQKHSIRETARRFGVSNTQVQQWLRTYEKHGVDGLCSTNNSYTGEYKIYVVELMHKNHWSTYETASHFCIPSHDTVGKWERIYYEKGADALNRDGRGRPRKDMAEKKVKTLSKQTEEDLIAEVQRLRMENEFLKKKMDIRERMMEEKRKQKSSSKQ